MKKPFTILFLLGITSFNTLANESNNGLISNLENNCINFDLYFTADITVLRSEWDGKCTGGKRDGAGTLIAQIKKADNLEETWEFNGLVSGGVFINGSLKVRNSNREFNYQGEMDEKGAKGIGVYNITNFTPPHVNVTKKGFFRNWMLDGKGSRKEVIDSRTIIMNGTFKSDKMVGQGEYIDMDKDYEEIYTGSFLNSKFHGNGKLERFIKNNNKKELDYTYEGQFQDGKLHGKGVMRFYSNNIIIETATGDFQNDFFHGKVVIVTDSGLSSEATFINGKYSGPVTISFKNGAKVHGEFKDGISSGFFRIEYLNNKKVIKLEGLGKNEAYSKIQTEVDDYIKLVSGVGQSLQNKSTSQDCGADFPKNSIEEVVMISGISIKGVEYCYDLTSSNQRQYITQNQVKTSKNWFNQIKSHAKKINPKTDFNKISHCSDQKFKIHQDLLSVHFVGAMFPGVGINFPSFNPEIASYCNRFATQLQLQVIELGRRQP